MERIVRSLFLASMLIACGGPDPLEVEPLPLTLTVAGDVTIDGINPAIGSVAILDPAGRRLTTVAIVHGRYRAARHLDSGIDVCDGFAVFTEIVEERGRRSQARDLDESSGTCTISPEDETVHHVDLDFPIILGSQALRRAR